MLVTVDIEQKTIGPRRLFSDLKLNVEPNEKVAIIGRNGIGKTTLFRILTGDDTDYSGTVTFRQGTRVVATHQEHHGIAADTTAYTYVVDNLPDYAELKHLIDAYPATMGNNMAMISRFSEALERFNQLDYFTIEDRVRTSLEAYQIDPDMPMIRLSGGQKRFVELVRIEHASANLALIDEPTNHMDYVAKAAFLDWFTHVGHAVVVITHDRDLLATVQRIIEIKDGTAISYPGNYAAYLRENALRTTNALGQYETAQRQIANIRKQIQYARSKKSSWGGTADKKNPFVVMETRLTKELEVLQNVDRPSFWIDRESVDNLRPRTEEAYQKHKAATIRIRHYSEAERQRTLLHLEGVQVGYTSPLFSPIKLSVTTGERIRIVGRNGAGKTTLTRAILDVAAGIRPDTLLHGTITPDTKLRVNNYEQEIDEGLMDITLGLAVERLYEQYDKQLSSEQIMRLLADYLFDPRTDREQPVHALSGGQKARLQLMKLFANSPNLIILDEPTNHLDLPSIEELESALQQYRGAVVYVSHDSYLAKRLGGTELLLEAITKS